MRLKVNQFDFEHFEEALHHGVVPAAFAVLSLVAGQDASECLADVQGVRSVSTAGAT